MQSVYINDQPFSQTNFLPSRKMKSKNSRNSYTYCLCLPSQSFFASSHLYQPLQMFSVPFPLRSSSVFLVAVLVVVVIEVGRRQRRRRRRGRQMFCSVVPSFTGRFFFFYRNGKLRTISLL